MGFLDRLLGRMSGRPGGQGQGRYGPGGYNQGHGQGYGQGQAYGYGNDHDGSGGRYDTPVQGTHAPLSADEQAIRRYQYLLKTAPPEQIERAHAEAFAALTPSQRQQVLRQLVDANPKDRLVDDSPQSLARAATRMEMRQPGSLFRTFGGTGSRMGGMGMGMGIGGALLSSVAGAFIGSAIAHEMFDDDGFMDWDTDGDVDGGQGLADGADGYGYENAGNDYNGDMGGNDFGGGDFGEDFDGGDFG